MTLKELRISKKITQSKAAEICGISLRSYVSFENDSKKNETIKYNYLFNTISDVGFVDETHGILDAEQIKDKCFGVFEKYKIKYCYLFGSYAKNKATEKSDVDLLIASDVHGLEFFGMAEELREALNKKTDILDFNQLKNNHELLDEILHYGVKIYG